MADKAQLTGLPIEKLSEQAYDGSPVEVRRAQSEISQASGFKAAKSITTQADGHTVTEYRVDVDGTRMVATIDDAGNASLATTRGRVSASTSPGLAEQNFAAAMTKALGRTAPSGAAPQQEAKDFATVMERAFADNKISPGEVKTLTELNGAAQELPARGPRSSIAR